MESVRENAHAIRIVNPFCWETVFCGAASSDNGWVYGPSAQPAICITLFDFLPDVEDLCKLRVVSEACMYRCQPDEVWLDQRFLVTVWQTHTIIT
jgi:hypothetical protein